MNRTLALPALLAAALVSPTTLAAQAAPTAPVVPQWVGEVRVRTEMDRRTADTAADHATLLRTRLGVRVPVSPRVLLFAQLQDARAFGEEENTLTDASADRLDLHQGWIQLADTVAGLAAELRVGRQEMAFGDERLVGAVGWSNTGRAFDAARLRVGALKLWAADLRERDRLLPVGTDPRRNTGAEGDHLFLGAYLDARPGDLYLLHDRNAAEGPAAGIDRTTAGGRVELRGTAGPWLEGEAAYQFGRRERVGPAEREQDVRAWMAVGRAGWRPAHAPLRNAWAGVDWLSGDDDPADGTYGAFHTLYGTNHKFYGLMDLFLDPAAQTGGRGLVDAQAGATLALSDRHALEVAVHRFALARRAAEGRALGWEADLTLPFPLAPGMRGLAGYSLFRTGEAAPAAGLPESGRTLHWGYLQLQVAF